MLLDDKVRALADGSQKLTLRFGEVVAMDGSRLVVAAKAGGTVYATNYTYCEVGDMVCFLACGPTCVAFAAKDASRVERELQQAGIGYEAGAGISISGHVISADVTQGTIDGIRNDVIPISVIEAL